MVTRFEHTLERLTQFGTHPRNNHENKLNFENTLEMETQFGTYPRNDTPTFKW